MSPSQPTLRGKYFEEFEVGLSLVSSARTVTETDIVTFAGLSGDYNQIHTDKEYAAGTEIGQRVAHGLLVLSIASGLIIQTGLMEGTIIVFREINNWKFVKPVFIGDTVHVVISVTETKAIPRISGGLVKVEMDVKNQKDETVMKGVWVVLIHSKPE